VQAEERRVPELDGLRGVACLLVLVHHYALGIAEPDPGTTFHAVRAALYPLFLGGVDLFFVLSGFLIGGILMDERGSDRYFRTFWIRRVARIMPVYIMLFASFYFALAIRPDGAWPWADEWLLKPAMSFWSYATFTQNFAMAGADSTGPLWVTATWSLAIEEQFYWILPVIVAVVSRRFIVGLAVACVIAAPVIRTILAMEWNWFAAYTLLPARMENLMCGVLVACLIRNERALKTAMRHRRAIDVALVGLLGMVLGQLTIRFATRFDPNSFISVGLNWFVWTLVSFVFALALLRIFLHQGGRINAILRSRVLVGAGLISYGVYMYHEPINGLLQGFILGQQPRFATWADAGVAALAVCVVLVVSGASYIFVENPIRRWAARRASYREPTLLHTDGKLLPAESIQTAAEVTGRHGRHQRLRP